MSSQHLSDEAVAAFADGVLRGLARDRAARHVNGCGECRLAVQVQREAAWTLRTATTPPPSNSLLDRLRSLPATTPLDTPPTVVAPDGTTMLATFSPVAAFVPGGKPQRESKHLRTFMAAAIAVAAAGTLASGTVAGATGHGQPATNLGGPAKANPAGASPEERPALNQVNFLRPDRRP